MCNCLVRRRVVGCCGVGRDDLRYRGIRQGHHAPVKKVDFVLKVMIDLQFQKISLVFGEVDPGVEIE